MPKLLNNLNLQGNQLLNARLQVLGADPSTLLSTGRIFYQSAVNRPRWYDGTNFQDIWPMSQSATANTAAVRDGSGNLAGNVLGNAATATAAGKWSTPRTITLGTDLSGNVSFDGSANVTLNATVANNAITTAKILDGNVTLPKLASISAVRLIGRLGDGSGSPYEITAAEARGTFGYTGVNGVSVNNTNGEVGFASGHSPTFTNVVVTGDLEVQGTLTTTTTEEQVLEDPTLILGGATPPVSDDGLDRGVQFRWHNGAAAKLGFFGFRRSSQKWVFIPDATNTSGVFSGALGELDVSIAWANILSKPTTLSGYGITDGVPTSRTISAGTGLTGGGSLSSNRTLSVVFGTTAGTVCQGNDSRLTDSRTPTSHNHDDLYVRATGGTFSGNVVLSGSANEIRATASGATALTHVMGWRTDPQLYPNRIYSATVAEAREAIGAHNASNLTSGTLPSGRLPALGGDVSSSEGSNSISVNRVSIVDRSNASILPTGQKMEYYWSSGTPTDFPSAAVGCGLLVPRHNLASSRNSSFTLFSSSVADEFFLRKIVSDAWGPWRQIWHSGNFTPGNYLALTGGTLTGVLIAGAAENRMRATDAGEQMNFFLGTLADPTSGHQVVFSRSRANARKDLSAAGFFLLTISASATEITVTHNLNTRDVAVRLQDTATYEEVLTDWEAATVNTVILRFATAPASNSLRIMVTHA